MKFCHFAGEDPGVKIEELADLKLVLHHPLPPPMGSMMEGMTLAPLELLMFLTTFTSSSV